MVGIGLIGKIHRPHRAEIYWVYWVLVLMADFERPLHHWTQLEGCEEADGFCPSMSSSCDRYLYLGLREGTKAEHKYVSDRHTKT